MESKQPILSICIPTYNRADYLIENLKVLIPQIKIFSNEVELLISDNASNEENYVKLRNFLCNQDCPHLFFRHEKNIGGNANFNFISGKAIGDYLFLLGDDDILSSSFLEIVLPYLRSHAYSVVHWNRLIGDAVCSKNKIQRSIFDGLTREIPMQEFLKEDSFDATFMSSVIVSKEAWQLGKQYEKDEYYGYMWYGRICWGSVLDTRPVLWYYMPLVLHRNPPKTWIRDFPIYLIIGIGNIYQDLEQKIPGIYSYGQQWIRKICDIEWTIKEMGASDQSYYRQYETQFVEHLTEDEGKMLHYWLHVKHLKIALKIYRVKFYIKKACSVLKRCIKNLYAY
jgi:glycosyltransferase involved in cell wall biosynthesis